MTSPFAVDRSSRAPAFAVAGALAMAGLGTPALTAQEPAATASPLAVPAEPLAAVRAAFTAAPGMPRFLAVLSPT